MDIKCAGTSFSKSSTNSPCDDERKRRATIERMKVKLFLVISFKVDVDVALGICDGDDLK